jgi:hypothetical protein
VFQRAYTVAPRFFLCELAGVPIAGLGLISESGKVAPGLFQSYNGLHFREAPGLKLYKRIEERFAASEALAKYLFSEFKDVALNHHSTVQDMRPFDWINFHEREKGHFKIRVLYTSHLDIRPDQLLSNCKGVRLNSLKISEKHDLVTRRSDDVAILDRLHRLTFERQDMERGKGESEALRSICERLMSSGAGRLYVTFRGSSPASACFLGTDSRRGYYLFGASDPEFRKTESGTRNLIDAFRDLNAETGLSEVDLVGVNSPQRGGFKLSFGGTLVPYYSTIKTAEVVG